jgi:hypothetical protein
VKYEAEQEALSRMRRELAAMTSEMEAYKRKAALNRIKSSSGVLSKEDIAQLVGEEVRIAKYVGLRNTYQPSNRYAVFIRIIRPIIRIIRCLIHIMRPFELIYAYLFGHLLLAQLYLYAKCVGLPPAYSVSGYV